MAREFPRFLFAKEMPGSQSKGPFLVHTLKPRFIVRIEGTSVYLFKLVHLENFDDATNPIVRDVIQTIMHDARKWVVANADSIFSIGPKCSTCGKPLVPTCFLGDTEQFNCWVCKDDCLKDEDCYQAVLGVGMPDTQLPSHLKPPPASF